MTKSVKFKQTESFESALKSIEDYVFDVRGEILDVEKFLDQLSSVIEFILNNSLTPSIDTKTGDRTRAFNDGRYRLFYSAIDCTKSVEVLLTDIDANQAANLDRFPEHKINDEDTFVTED